MDNNQRVLVTGGSGFVAGHCVEELQAHGYRVRVTVRDVAARAKYRHLGDDVDVVQADLTSDDGWATAVAGCTAVMHVASPFPLEVPADEEAELIRPAVEGTLRVLRACAEAGTVQRVVLTSSIAAIAAGHLGPPAVRTEQDWSVPERSRPYQRSKTLAERAAWDFAAANSLDLVVINPGMILGPVQHAAASTSHEVVRRLLGREMPGAPCMGFATVDVRDLAVAHRLALESPQAVGNRYICAGDNIWTGEVAMILAEEFTPRGHRVPTRNLPNWLMRVAAVFDPALRAVTPYLGREELVSADKAIRDLGWTMRPVRESIIDTAESLLRHGLVKA